MEVNFYLSILIIFVSSLSFGSLFLVYYRHRSPFTAPNLPPGTMGYPVVGESLQFLSTGWKGRPEKFFSDRIAKYSSVIFKTSIFCQPTVVFCGAARNKFLFSNENKLVRAWWPQCLNKLFPSSNPTEESKKLRQVVTQFLKAESVQRYVGIMDAMAQSHFASFWENKTQVTVYPLAKRFTFALSCRFLMSVEDENLVAKLSDPFQHVASGVISMPIDFPGTPFNKAVKAANFIRKELLGIVRQRKVDLAEGNNHASPTQDILSYMLTTCTEDGQYIPEVQIAGRILGLLVGSHDTASVTCTSIVKYLAELPHIYERVYHEQMEISKSKAEGELLNWDDVNKMRYSWNVACEVMRLYAPIQGTFREAMSDFIFDGYSIPKGWKLYWTANSTHRSPEYFPEPEKFDPRRFEGNGPTPYTFVPFGGGPRMCPGKEYARVEILVFMHNLVKRFKWKKLIPNEKIVVNPLPMLQKNLPIFLYPLNKA